LNQAIALRAETKFYQRIYGEYEAFSEDFAHDIAAHQIIGIMAKTRRLAQMQT